jgi:hypothetical protein
MAKQPAPITRSTNVNWDMERISLLSTPEIRQLRSNADRLGQQEIASLCEQILGSRPRGILKPPTKRRRKVNRNLVSRSKGFELRGAVLANARSSWGSVRKADNTVIFCLWNDAIQVDGANCSYLLWAPNTAGSRPWSDLPGGKERLEQCLLAEKNGRAEALLAYGVALDGHLPEDRAQAVDGVDQDTVLAVRVERRAGEYWGTWNRSQPADVGALPPV